MPVKLVEVAKNIEKKAVVSFSVFYIVSPRLLSSIVEEMYYYAEGHQNMAHEGALADSSDIIALAEAICVRAKRLTQEQEKSLAEQDIIRYPPPAALFNFLNDVGRNADGTSCKFLPLDPCERPVS